MKPLIWLVSLWLSTLPLAGQAQVLGWERTAGFFNGNIANYAYPHLLADGDYLVHGVAYSGLGYPLTMARYHPNGTLVRQQIGRTLYSVQQDLLPLESGNYLLAASVPQVGTVQRRAGSLFFQRLRPNGDTLLGHSYLLSPFEAYPVRMARDGDSVRVLCLSANANAQYSTQYVLVTVDTAGVVGRVRPYDNPSFGNAYPCDMARTPRGGWLFAGKNSPNGAFFRTYLVETDAQGRLRRRRTPVFFTGGGHEIVDAVWNNMLRLRDGSGYVVSGRHEIGAQTWGFLAKLDTALNVVWTYRHPPQATANLSPRQVYELADGTLGWLAGDEGGGGYVRTSNLYAIRVSASGQLLSQGMTGSANCSSMWLYAWLPLPNGQALVVGGNGTCVGGFTSSAAYVARLDQTLVLATAPAHQAAAGALYPNPASGFVTWQGAVPTGARLAQVQVLDALGRVVRTQAVAGRGGAVSQEVSLAGLAAGAYACRLLLEGQPSGAVSRLSVLP